MKSTINLIFGYFLSVGCLHHNHDLMQHSESVFQDFKAERTIRSSSITLNDNIDNVFPLFTPELEKRWTSDWTYVPIYMNIQKPEEHDVFSTHGHIQDEGLTTWVISKLDTVHHVIEYMLFTSLRTGVIHIECQQISPKQTNATITYSFTGLTDQGNELCRHLVNKIYQRNLKDWEEDINNYLRIAVKHA
jgi:hypothetical protein